MTIIAAHMLHVYGLSWVHVREMVEFPSSVKGKDLGCTLMQAFSGVNTRAFMRPRLGSTSSSNTFESSCFTCFE